MNKENSKIKLNKQESSGRYFLFIGLIIVVLSGLLIFSYTQLNSAATKVADQKSLLNQYTLEIAKISNLLDEHEDVEEMSILLTDAIPDKDNLVDFIENIERIGDILELDLKVTMSDGVVDEDGVVVDVLSDSSQIVNEYANINSVEVLEVGLTARTSTEEFDKVINFIGMLDDMKYYSKIVDMKIIKSIDEVEETAYLDSVFTLNLYVKSGIK